MVKTTILLCYKQADQQSLYLVQVKAHDIRAFAASKAFHGGVSLGQIMQACHWKAHNTFPNFYLKDLTLSDYDNIREFKIPVHVMTCTPKPKVQVHVSVQGLFSKNTRLVLMKVKGLTFHFFIFIILLLIHK